jgi:hypothetical protein
MLMRSERIICSTCATHLFFIRMQEHALPKGHSTARMAGAFAARLEAKRLLLTHFRCHLLCISRRVLLFLIFAVRAFSPAPGMKALI